MTGRTLALALCALAALAAGGCVERRLLIQSEPAGAEIEVNGRHIGRAPVIHSFETYGTFEIVAALPRHRRLRTFAPVKAPWYEWIPLDFFVESVWPWTVTDERNIVLRMEPLPAEDEAGIDRREVEAQQRLEKGAR